MRLLSGPRISTFFLLIFFKERIFIRSQFFNVWLRRHSMCDWWSFCLHGVYGVLSKKILIFLQTKKTWNVTMDDSFLCLKFRLPQLREREIFKSILKNTFLCSPWMGKEITIWWNERLNLDKICWPIFRFEANII